MRKCKTAGQTPNTALMVHLGNQFNIEDKAVPMLCLNGMPIVGNALESPFFELHDVPAQITLQEFLSTAPRRRKDSLRRVKLMAESEPVELAKAIWDKTMKKVAGGTMAGPYTSDKVLAKHGKYFNVVPSFGLQQGNAADGSVKYRRIDDHTASHNNLAAHRRQKINMAMVDYLAIMVKSLGKQSCHPVLIREGGHEECLSLPDEQVAISITAIYNPETS